MRRDDLINASWARRRFALVAVLALGVAVVGGLASGSSGSAAPRAVDACGIPDKRPLWIDYADGSVPFWASIFRRPGVIAAASHFSVPPQLRAAGAATVYFDLHLNNRVGRPTSPVAPAKIEDAADRLYFRAVASSGCATPIIALNELFGASTATPWSPGNGQYRANVLTFLRRLTARGARPHLLISSTPYTGGEAAEWWRQAAQSSELIREMYFGAPRIKAQGPVLGSRTMRRLLRTGARDLIEIGVPPERIGFMLGFQTTRGIGGREGLQPARAWFRVIKLEALAAKEVTRELGLGSVWSWGWAGWTEPEQDPDKEAAACVWLWARNPALCNGPRVAGARFNASLAEGQVPRGALECTFEGRRLLRSTVSALEGVTQDRDVARSALFARDTVRERADVSVTAVDAAERLVVRVRHGGSWSAYRAALRGTRATRSVARAVIADQLRRREVVGSLRAPRVTDAAIVAFYTTYGSRLARPVSARPAPWWLDWRRSGLALASVAPRSVFGLRAGVSGKVRTRDGWTRVVATGGALPLSAYPLRVAAPAIRAALKESGRERAYEMWLVRAKTAALNTAVCAGDELPAAGAVDLTSYLPFLAVP